MIFHRELRHKKGVGSIIGAAFLLLILLTGFTYYNFYFNEYRRYTRVLQEMQQLDFMRSAEEIRFVSVSTTDQNKLNVTVKNTGSYQVNFIWIGIHDESMNSQEYYSVDFYVDPGETMADIRNETITIPDGECRGIQLITELGNIFSCSYPEDAFEDGYGGQSKITIKGITETTYHPSQWNLVNNTEHVSGNVSDLSGDDGNYAIFSSYYSGTGSSNDLTDYVDNDTSNVDGSSDKGTHNDFSAQQAGPDTILDTLIEENTATSPVNSTLIDQESFEGTWLPAEWSEIPSNSNWNKENDQASDMTYSADFDGWAQGRSGGLETPDLDCLDADAIYLEFWYRDEGCDNNEFVLEYYDDTSWDTITDLGSTASEYQWLHYEAKITDSQYFKSNFRIRWSAVDVEGGESAYVDFVTVKKESGGSNYELDLEVQWTSVDYDEANEELSIYFDENSHSMDATGGYIIVGDGTPDWGSARGTISFWIKWDTVDDRPWGQDDNMELRFSGTNLVVDWGAAGSITSSTSFTSGRWYFIAVVWNENTDELYLYVGDEDSSPTEDTHVSGWTDTVSTVGVTENNFMASMGGLNPTDGLGDDLRYWDIDRSLTDIESDYDIELSGSESNLRSYYKLNNDFVDCGPGSDGSGSGSYSFSSDVPFGGSAEEIDVDVWDGATWQNLFTDLIDGWNNASVSTYLNSPTFTIRFKGGSETNDASQDSWSIDAALLYIWSSGDEKTAEVEFTGTSNTEEWTELYWEIDSCWDVGETDVTIRLYDYVSGGYAVGRDGFFSYTSDPVPETDETVSQNISMDPANFRDASGNWRVKVEGVKSTINQFLMKVDLIELRPKYTFSGESIPYDVWQQYVIKATTSEGKPIPYASLSIYVNGTNVLLRDAMTLAPLTNPDWVYLNAMGEYYLEIRSSSGAQEDIVLNAVVGSVVSTRTITQEAP